MRRGTSAQIAAQDALERIIKHYPEFSGALIAVRKDGEIGAYLLMLGGDVGRNLLWCKRYSVFGDI